MEQTPDTLEDAREALFRSERRASLLQKRVERLDAVNTALRTCLSDDLGVVDTADLFIRLVSSMTEMIAFDHVLVFTPIGGGMMRSEAACCAPMVGRTFRAGPAARKALAGRPLVTTAARVIDCGPGGCETPFPPEAHALAAPFRHGGVGGFALFVRLPEATSFDRDELDVAAQIAVLAAQTLSLKAAARASAARARFLASMSHELRTPLNGVLGMADVLDHGVLTESQHRLVGVIRRSAAELVGVIDSILNYVQVETGAVSLASAPFGLLAAVREAVARRMPEAQAKGLRIALAYDVALPTRVIGDARRVGEILDALIDNAVKQTPTGHVAVRVGGARADDRLSLSIEVADTGPGVPEADRDTIFEPFNQGAHGPGLRPAGVGLGLAVARRLAQEMGGGLTVADGPDGGALFRFDASFSVDASAPAPPGPDALADMAVAVIDPDAATRRATAERLAAWGARVAVFGETPSLAGLATVLGPDGVALAERRAALRLRAMGLMLDDPALRRATVLELDPCAPEAHSASADVISALAPRGAFVAAIRKARDARRARAAASFRA
ncbi:MAG: hypothetical protein EA355_04860 [Rhodobacteraceae bacterium]|nr:MAG: hypothetical protein EA355_04860 [Paracoccaceae bacterium]